MNERVHLVHTYTQTKYQKHLKLKQTLVLLNQPVVTTRSIVENSLTVDQFIVNQNIRKKFFYLNSFRNHKITRFVACSKGIHEDDENSWWPLSAKIHLWSQQRVFLSHERLKHHLLPIGNVSNSHWQLSEFSDYRKTNDMSWQMFCERTFMRLVITVLDLRELNYQKK